MYTCIANIKTTHKRNYFSYIGKTCIIFAIIITIFAFFILMNIKNVNYFASAENNTKKEESVEKDLEDATNDVLSDVDFSDLEEVLAGLDFEIFDGRTFKQFVKDVINGKEEFTLSSMFEIFKVVLMQNIKNIVSPLLIVFCVALLSVLFSNLSSNKNGGAGDVINLICFSVIVIIVSVLISKLIVVSKNSLSQMQNSMNAIFPILLVLMSGMGGVISAKAYTPLVTILSNIISNVFVYFLLPLFSLSLVFSIVGHISPNTKLDKMNSFLKSLFKWTIGLVCALFMGYLAIKGFTAGSSDGISIKAAKYAIKNYVPILGGYISEGFELVKAGSLIVKNAVGFVGILMLVCTALFPVVAVAVCELFLKLVAGVLQPVGGTKTAGLLGSIADSLKLLSSIIIGVAMMYFLTIYLVTCTVLNIL